MPYLSNLQQLITAAVFGYSGYGLIFSPARTLAQLSPFFNLIEQHTSLKRYNGSQDGLMFFGIGLLSMSYFYLMGVYTGDEKFKRNSTPGRFILAFLSYYICTSQSQHASSLLALFGLYTLTSGLMMGISVGFGDGNEVDLEREERKKRFLEARKKENEKQQ
ncbi:hypothetical protein JCM5353_001274 [Sporobolomyces roseus]